MVLFLHCFFFKVTTEELRKNFTPNQILSCLVHLFGFSFTFHLMSLQYIEAKHPCMISDSPLHLLPGTKYSLPPGETSGHMVGYHIIFISKQRRTPQTDSEKQHMQGGIASSYRGVLQTIHSQSESGRQQHRPK